MAKILLSQLKDVDWSSTLRFLGREEVPKALERQAVAAMKRDTERIERAEAAQTAEWRRLTKAARALRRESARTTLSRDQLEEATRVVRQTSKRYPAPKPFKPAVEKEEPSIVIGSLGATVVPPYDFWWTYENKSGPVQVSTTARQSDGYLYCDVRCPKPSLLGDSSFAESSGVSRAAVGIFFQPLIDGTLEFSASLGPLISYSFVDSIFCDVRSRGEAGLQVYRFKLNGTLDPSPPEGQFDKHEYYKKVETELWYRESGGPKSSSYTPSFKIVFNVSKNRFYNLWVYARVNAYSDGADFFYAGSAVAETNGFVPNIKWKLTT